MDWNALTLLALSHVGADKVMVPGARLRQAMELLADERGFDVRAHLAETGRSFSQLVDEVDGVRIRRRPGSDMLVGLEGSDVPASPSPKVAKYHLRRDVWEAFTKLSRERYVYQPDADRFVLSGEAQGPSVAVPEVTLDLHLQDRREFLDTLPANIRDALADVLQRSSRPLADFRVGLEEKDVLHDWMKFHVERTVERVMAWVEDNQIDVRRAWFASKRSGLTPQQVLERLAPYMTSDEVYEIKIPIRVVEAMLSDIAPR